MDSYLLGLCVASLAGLILLPLGEADAEDAEKVSVGRLDVGVGIDQSLPLLDHGAELVSGQVHAVEVGQAVLALNLLAEKTELFEGPLGILLALQIGQGDLVDASLQTIGGDPGTLGTVDKGLADIPNLEDGRGLDVVPVLAGEGVDDLLLGTLLAAYFKALKPQTG